jgi:phage anti-repressor protein
MDVMTPKDYKAKVAFEKNINDYSAVEFSATVEGGFAGPKEVKSYILTVEDAKFFVAGYNNEIGKAYRRHLIQCESTLKQVGIDLTKVFVSPTVGIMFLKEVEKKNDTIKLLSDDKEKLKRERTWIAERQAASAMNTASNLTQYIKKNGLPVPKYAKGLEQPKVDEAAVEELAKQKAAEYMTKASDYARKASEAYEDERKARINAQIQADEAAKLVLFYQKQEREANEAATNNWPKPEWRARADILREWGIDTSAPGQQGWKDFGVFCRGLSPSLSRWNDITKKYELRADVADKFRAQIVDFFTIDLGILTYEGIYSGEF